MYTLCKYKRDWKMNWEYLSHQHLVGFEQYQYSSVDTNPISVYIMHPFWERIVLLFPKWVAPNVLTFVGFLCTAGACLLLSIYDYEFYASSSDHPEYSSVPRWIFMAAAVSIFIAYTLDGIDGKQARRTRSSGPLGELFDHGLDSWTAVLIPTCLYSVFGRTDYSVPPVRFYFVCWNVFITFYMSHWEKYNTGVLFLPWGYDLSMLATTGVFVITYLFGHEWWKFKVFEGIATGHILELLFYLSSVVSSLPVVLWNIYKSYQDRTGKMRSFWEANRPLVPLTGFLFICAVWVYYSPSDIISRDPRAFYLTCGTIFSNICIWHRGVEPCGGHCCWMRGGQLDQHGTMTCVFMVVWCWESFSDSPVAPWRYIFFVIGLRCRLIVAQMSNTRCEVYNWLLVPTALCTFLSIYVPSPALEITLLYGLWAFSTLAHIHYGTCVVRQMCSHFNINCFSIKKGTYSE